MSLVETVDCTHAATSRRTIRVALLGYGRVGQAVAALAESRRGDLCAAGVDLQIARALVRDPAKLRHGPRLPLSASDEALFDDADAVIEVLGGIEPARSLVAAALERGIPVVTANKSLVAACGSELRAQARRHGTAFACEAAVIAGVPFVNMLSRRPLFARARAFEGILNGTSHFVLSEMSRGATFAQALRVAVQHGFAEPDSAADVDGRDAAEKLAILLHLCGWETLAVGEIPRAGIDTIEPEDLSGASRLGGAIKPVAVAHLDCDAAGTAWVGPAFVPASHALARLDGVDNALTIVGAAGERVTFTGPGAGPAVTAATILDDLIEALTNTPPADRATVELRCPHLTLHPPAGRWFLRLTAGNRLDAAEIVEWLAWRRLAALHVVEADGRLYVRTTRAPWTIVRDVVEACHGRGWVPLALPVVD